MDTDTWTWTQCRQGHVVMDAVSVCTETDRHTPGHTDSGTVHGQMDSYAGTRGHRQECSPTVHRQTDRHTHGPGRDTAPGGTARMEAQGMLSDGTLTGNGQNAALGALVPSLDPATSTPHQPHRGGPEPPSNGATPCPRPRGPAHLTAPAPQAGPAAPAGPPCGARGAVVQCQALATSPPGLAKRMSGCQPEREMDGARCRGGRVPGRIPAPTPFFRHPRAWRRGDRQAQLASPAPRVSAHHPASGHPSTGIAVHWEERSLPAAQQPQ